MASLTVRPTHALRLHPVLVVLAMLVVTMLLTHIIPAGRYTHQGTQVVAGTYHPVPMVRGMAALVSPRLPRETDSPAQAAGIVALFRAVPDGLVRASTLLFMILCVGGTFGVLRATGTIDAGVDRLVHGTSGRPAILAGGLLVLLACGSTFLGFSSEYVALIPVVQDLGRRLRLPNLFAPAVIALADFIGYGVSVTNPIVLSVAQPIAGVPVFSGIGPRLLIFAILLAVGLAYLLWVITRWPAIDHVPHPVRLTPRQVGVFVTVLLGGAGLVTGTVVWSWHTADLAPVFIALGVCIAVVGGVRPAAAADAFLEGMKGMMLPCLLIGVAGGIGVMLQSSQVLDTIVQRLAERLAGHTHGTVAVGLMMSEMGFGVLMPSASAKAAVSLPILAPIAGLAGVSGHVTVTALLLGSGFTNMITPTNPLLLAFLAAADVDYADWARFIAPLFVVFTGIGAVALYLMASIGG